MLRLHKGEAGEIHVNRNQDVLKRVKIKQTRTQTMKKSVVTAASSADPRKYIRSYTHMMVYHNTQCKYIYICVCVCVCVCVTVWKRI
jgi:hypothetical protein